MQAQPTEPASNGICVAHGYGLKIHVHRGHLIVQDGAGRDRRTRRYHRVTSKLRRLVVVGHTGYVTLEALRWLHDLGAAMVHLDSDASLITTSTTTGPGQSGLRRAQALASISSTGIEVARELLHTKVSGQASMLSEINTGGEPAAALARAVEKIQEANDLARLVAAEAEAAAAYWEVWSSVAVPVRDSTPARIPEHWTTFGRRHSLVTNSPRLASNPANAILNYLYALLEAEAVLACHVVGLDPMLGIVHTDQRNRASLALDVMEAVRPAVDAYLLAMLTQRTLSRRDFIETRQGACRITSSLAGRLAETIDTWRHHIAPVAEGVAQRLAQDSRNAITISSPLTRAHHRAAWSERMPDRSSRGSGSATPVIPNACKDCGTFLPDRRRRYCEPCRGARWAKHAGSGRETAAAVLARLRAEERDPAHGGRAAENRRCKNAAHQRAVREWTDPLPDPQIFISEILPLLGELRIEALTAATGLSPHYCSLIRLGKKVPHARHWDALRKLASRQADAPRDRSSSNWKRQRHG